MQLLRNMFRGLVVAALAFGLLASAPKSSFAFTNGQYNKITIQACASLTVSDFDVLVVVDSVSGGTLILADVLTVLAVLPICHPGGAFFAFLNNGAVTNVVVVPGL